MFVPNNHPLWENQGWIRILLVKIGLLSSCHFMIHVMPDLAKIFKHKSFPTTIISPVIYIYKNAYAQEEGKPSLCNFMNHCVYPHSHRPRMECLQYYSIQKSGSHLHHCEGLQPNPNVGNIPHEVGAQLNLSITMCLHVHNVHHTH